MNAEGIQPKERRKLYGVGTLVNNNLVISDLESRGMVFVEDPRDVPEGEVAMISAHGLSISDRDILAQRRLKVIDSTCPLVEIAHVRRDQHIREAQAAGMEPKVLYICKPDDLAKGHKEVRGFIGSAPDVVQPITDEQDIEALKVEENISYAVDTQTTLNIALANAWIDKLKIKIPGLKVPPEGDVCYATKNRQTALRQTLALEPQVLFAFGSTISSNTRQLKKIAEAAGVATHLLETADLLTADLVDGLNLVAVTAGASAPPAEPDKALEKLAKWGYDIRELRVANEPATFKRNPVTIDYRGGSV